MPFVMGYLHYLIILILLFVAMLVYFRIAFQYNIFDKPNERSSHQKFALRGAGIIFPFSIILYTLFFRLSTFDLSFAVLLAGLLAISLLGFWDDIRNLPMTSRMLIQLLPASALLYATGAFSVLPFWAVIIAYILIIGTINAFNFMDGINGILGLYSLVVLAGLQYMNLMPIPGADPNMLHFTDPNMIWLPMLACLVFLFFNFRKKAKCFAGDVGSVSIAFWIVLLILKAMLQTEHLVFLLFLSVYGVDSVLTIIHRLILKQNIFEAHRLHFYQILVNEQKMPHLWVAFIYAALQAIIILPVLFIPFFSLSRGIIFIIIPLSLVYIILKPRLMRRSPDHP